MSTISNLNPEPRTNEIKKQKQIQESRTSNGSLQD